MLEEDFRFTVDPASTLCVDTSGNDEVLFVRDTGTSPPHTTDVGSIKVSGHSVDETAFRLGPFERRDILAAGLLSSGSKVVAYSTEGHIACYDRARGRNVPCDAATLQGRRPAVIRCAAAARAADDVFFFSLVGVPAVHVLYFGPGRDGSTVGRMTASVRIDSRHLEAGGVTLLECHPTQPYVVVAGADGPAEIFSYAPLLQRLRAVPPSAAGDTSFDADAGVDDDGHDPAGDRPPTLGRRRNNPRLFGLFAARRPGAPADLVPLATLAAPPVKKLEGAVSRVHRVSLHPAGGLMAAVFEYHNDITAPASPGGTPRRRAALATHVGVYKVGTLVAPTTTNSGVGQRLGPPELEAVAANRLWYCEADPKPAAASEPAHMRGAHRAVFSVCFHPAEPLLLVGLVARYPPRGRGSFSNASVPRNDVDEEDENYAEGGAFEGASGQQAVSIW